MQRWDQSATELIWQQLSDDLRRFIRRRVVDEHVAEDLLQETFLKIHRSLHDGSGPMHLSAWVYQVARNVVFDHYRTRKGTSVLDDSKVSNCDSNGINELHQDMGQWLFGMIQQLPVPYRHAIQLSEVEELPQKEIAKRLGLSISGAKSRIQRGRKLLKSELEQCCSLEFDRRGNVLGTAPRRVLPTGSWNSLIWHGPKEIGTRWHGWQKS